MKKPSRPSKKKKKIPAASVDRPKRPELERDHPLRQWSGLFGAPASKSARNGDARNGSPRTGDAVGTGVAMGYQVIDEYVRHGQEFARRVWSPPPSVADAASNPQRVTERMFQSASELATNWLSFMMNALPGAMAPWAAAAAPVAPAGPSHNADHRESPPGQAVDSSKNGVDSSKNGVASSKNGVAGQTAQVIFQIVSPRRVEASAEFKPGAAQRKLSAHALRSKGSSRRISGVAVTCDPDRNRISVRLTVPSNQPAGVYEGRVIDEGTDTPWGHITVEVPK